MKTVGIIVEYNPLHNGHVYHFQQARMVSGAGAVVAVMSGHFLQRGEPALVNKWTRTEMALSMGADLVLELPVAYASQPAEWFAYGAVSLLHATRCVDALCFGSENGSIEGLSVLARILSREPEAFRRLLRAELDTGASYPRAYGAAVRALCAATPELSGLEDAGMTPEEIAQPNNNLGLHYLIALERLGSPIRPLTIPRIKAGYHQSDITDAQIASATAIRRLVSGENGSLAGVRPYVPAYTYELLQREWESGRGPVNWESFATPLFHQLAGRSAAELARFAEVTEGLEHRIKRTLALLPSAEGLTVAALLGHMKTKRYTRTKLQRMLTRILLHHDAGRLSREALLAGPSYIRVLGFSETGRTLLKRIKQSSPLPAVTHPSKLSDPLLELDIQASSVYALAYAAPTRAELLRDYYEPPLMR